MKNYFLTACFIAALSGCGGGDTSPPSVPPIASVTKQVRPALESEDSSLIFNGPGTVTHAILRNVHGTITYQILDSTPPNVIAIDEHDQLQVLRPGTATVKAVDSSSYYEQSESVFTLTVERGANTELMVNDLHINPTERGDNSLTVRGQKGELTFSVASGDEHLIRVDQKGSVQPVGPAGIATVIVADSGNDFYQPKTIHARVIVHEISADQLQYAGLETEYREGVTLEPKRLDTTDFDSVSFRIVDSYPDDNVAKILNSETGLILARNTGRVTIEAVANYSDSYDHKQQTAYFTLDVLQGKREPLQVSNIAVTYAENGFVYPNVSHARGALSYRVLSGEDAITVSEDGKKLKILGVGQAQVEVRESSLRNYPSSKTTFDVEVKRALNSRIENVELKLIYHPDLRIPLEFPGQKGQISLVEQLPSGLRLVNDEIAVNQAGHYLLTLEDNGGSEYQPARFSVDIDVAKAVGEKLSVHNYEEVYSKDLQLTLERDFEAYKTFDHVEVLSNSNPEVANEIARGLIHVYRSGRTTLVLRRAESTNYTAGPEQEVKINILNAPSRIHVDSKIDAVWRPNKPYLSLPKITGTVGEVSYKIAEGEDEDVVSVDVHSGEMRILNAGSTMVVVSDTGSAQYDPGHGSFAVNITQADNPVDIKYPTVDFQHGKKVVPEVSAVDIETSYRLLSQTRPVVTLESKNTGEVSVLHAGSYKLEATLSARNYKTKMLSVNGSITKADHPGLSSTSQPVNFEPFKAITLELGPAIGMRSYAFENTISQELATLNAQTGVVTLNEYSPAHSIKLKVSEAESEDYKAMSDKTISIPVTLDKSDADREYTLTGGQTVVVSTLSAPEFANLQDSEFGLMGVRGVREPTDGEIASYGKGKVVLLQMKSIDNPEASTKGMWMHIARIDDCLSLLDEDNVKPFQAISYLDDGYCKTGRTLRMTRFLVIDDSQLVDGETYKIDSPLVYYRKGARKFRADDFGGSYADPDVIYGVSKYGWHKSLYEWGVIQMNYKAN
ncbi:cadherin repeat domain-containing protein [Vibrio rotiferianus]|uniref:cadherin repeat domain-containing protein n=1 Tax=Vibrio rotiferianus TaxID=190895 RepID=UPI00148B990E|nr:cadherin repeat domain-containing protein [Vibrio rotiferianus]NOH67437.1 cadherin repeat domain-containing protein [Vibrio rotiferianus]